MLVMLPDGTFWELHAFFLGLLNFTKFFGILYEPMHQALFSQKVCDRIYFIIVWLTVLVRWERSKQIIFHSNFVRVLDVIEATV